MDKQRLISLIEELLKEENLDKRADDLLYLKRQYKVLINREEETFYEKQQTNRVIELYDELAKKAPKLNQSAYDEKKEIIELARKLVDRKDVVNANRDLDKYSLAFKHAGRCSNEQEEELRAEFNRVKHEFIEKKNAYFNELAQSNAEKISKKKDIIERAKQLLNIKNIKESNDKMNALMEEWKTVGYSGKEDNALWEEFSSVRKEFNKQKREHHHEIQQLFVERAAKKEELIKVMKKLLADSDFSKEEVQKVKDLKNEFNKVGFTGKEKDEELNAEFDKVVKKYYEDKKFYSF